MPNHPTPRCNDLAEAFAQEKNAKGEPAAFLASDSPSALREKAYARVEGDHGYLTKLIAARQEDAADAGTTADPADPPAVRVKLWTPESDGYTLLRALGALADVCKDERLVPVHIDAGVFDDGDLGLMVDVVAAESFDAMEADRDPEGRDWRRQIWAGQSASENPLAAMLRAMASDDDD